MSERMKNERIIRINRVDFWRAQSWRESDLLARELLDAIKAERDHTNRLESLLNRWLEFYTDGAHPDDARILYTDTEKALEKQP